jgi:hypothetical protein
MIRKLSYPLAALLVLAGLLITGPAPAFATGCHHNNVSGSQWGSAFTWDNGGGIAYRLNPSPLMTAGDSSSACDDVNIQNATATCSTYAAFMIQYYNQPGGNYFGPISDNLVGGHYRPVVVTYGLQSLQVVRSNIPDGQKYRIDVDLNDPCSPGPNTPVLD